MDISTAKIVARLEALVGRHIDSRQEGMYIHPKNKPIVKFDHAQSVKWITDAEAALQLVFPPNHAVMRRWNATLSRADQGNTFFLSDDGTLPTARAIVEAALDQLKSGYLLSILDGVRSETVGNVLDQAETLLSSSYGVAAAVLAGGALETHLRNLCERNELTWTGDGSIGAYDDVIGRARNVGSVVVYSAADTKLVKWWGGVRNDAAHDPIRFSHTKDTVRRMIEGIREFLVRIP